jgi:hypothetical protein
MTKIVLISILLLAGCTDSDSVKNYAEIESWDSYEVTGYRWAACSQDDVFNTGFKATKNGKTFTGTVCKGWIWRGSTLRLD